MDIRCRCPRALTISPDIKLFLDGPFAKGQNEQQDQIGQRNEHEQTQYAAIARFADDTPPDHNGENQGNKANQERHENACYTQAWQHGGHRYTRHVGLHQSFLHVICRSQRLRVSYPYCTWPRALRQDPLARRSRSKYGTVIEKILMKTYFYRLVSLKKRMPPDGSHLELLVFDSVRHRVYSRNQHYTPRAWGRGYL